MLDFPLIWPFNYAGSYLSAKDKDNILYVRSSCLSTTLQFTDMND